MPEEARAAAESAARSSYGRLIAWLTARTRDVAAAEDALADAFQAALLTWPERGVPDRPEAWLLTVARHRLDHDVRRRRVRSDAAPTVAMLVEEIASLAPAEFPDERLGLMFVCAHPAIDAASRAPLMLQAVLGLDAARISAAFLMSPAAMGQRLVRAKTKIRDAAIGFALPERTELPERLESVLEAIYAAYGRGWDDLAGADSRLAGLGAEAIRLVRILVDLLPAEPEPKGLLALMLHCEARAAARRSPTGDFVPLGAQHVRLWSRPMIDEAERALATASTAGRVGRYQIEAAIQSAHAQRASTGQVDRGAIALLHEALALLAPTVGVLVARAVAVGVAVGATKGLSLLDAIPDASVAAYQPYWVARAHLLHGPGRDGERRAAIGRALGLTEDPAARRFLEAVALGHAAD